MARGRFVRFLFDRARDLRSAIGTGIAFLIGRLFPFIVTAVGLAVFFVGVRVLRAVLSPLGVSDQRIAAIAGAGVSIGLWLIGLRLLFGIDVTWPVRRIRSGVARGPTERSRDELDDHATELAAATESFGRRYDRFERTMRAYSDEPTVERERRIGRLLIELRDDCREIQRLASAVEERRRERRGYSSDEIDRIRRHASEREDDFEAALDRYETDVDAYVREWTALLERDVEEFPDGAMDDGGARVGTSDGWND